MKTKLTLHLLFLLFFSIDNISGQDSKWKDVSKITSCNFKVNISNPNIDCDPRARWDYFLIYEDGTFSTTRTKFTDTNNQIYSANTIDPVYNSGSTSNCNTLSGSGPILKFSDPQYNQQFAFPQGKKVKYFYISNIYDDDNPPVSAAISNISSGGLLLPTIDDASLAPLGSKYMFANQDVVAYEDVTLVISGNRLSTTSTNTLVIPSSMSGRNFPSESTYFYAGSNGSISNVSINDNGTTKNINFNVTGTINNLFINLTSNSDIYYYDEVSFELNPGIVGLSDTHTEKVLTAHDPNYIQLIDLCKPTPQCSGIAKYKINFQNNGDAKTSNIQVLVEFNNLSFDSVKKAYMSGCDLTQQQELTVSTINGNKYSYRLQPMTCLACKNPTKSKSNGQLFLEVKLKNGVDAGLISSLSPSSASVFFDRNSKILKWKSDYCNNPSFNCKPINSCKINCNEEKEEDDDDDGTSSSLIIGLLLLVLILIVYFLLKRNKN